MFLIPSNHNTHTKANHHIGNQIQQTHNPPHSHHKLSKGPATTTTTPSEASTLHAAGSTATPNLHLYNLMR